MAIMESLSQICGRQQMQINLNDAVQKISDTLDLQGNSKDYPYFFIVGAGISMPEVPSASQIIEICKRKVKDRGENVFNIANHKSSVHEDNPMCHYSFWVESAFPNPINRSEFYKSLILNSKISSANLMLAQILQSYRITNTVFTTNFDDKIKQSLDLIGAKEVFVSENAMDNLVVNINSNEIQIVHVHGTYRFYDSANLEKEINNVSEQKGTMSSFQVLRNYLQQKAPIVVGYSGWENDVIMTCIEERLSLPIPYNYIWVCFSQSDYNSLPNWLRSNDRVCFVIPDTHEKNCDEDDINIDMFLNQTGKGKVSKIPATLFLGKLISQLRILPPKIFINPYEYYSEMISKTLPHNEDVLHLKHWAERMKYYAKNDSPIDNKIRELELASISKDFVKSSEIIISLGQMDLSAPDINFLSKTIIVELLGDERIIKSADAKIKLSHSILEFAKKHYDNLLLGNSLDELLHNVLGIRFKSSEESYLIHILNTVYELSMESEQLIDVHLTSIGIKSSMAKEDSEKINLLNELLDKCPEKTTQKSLNYKKCLALFNKCELVDETEAIELYTQAEELCNKVNIKELDTGLLKCKAEVTLKLKNVEMQIKWATECLDAALALDMKKCKYKILKIVECLTRIQNDSLVNVDKVEEKLCSLLKTTYECDCDVENCECTLLMAKIYLSLTRITNKDSSKMEYCQSVVSLGSKLPHECRQYQINLFIALSELCKLSTLYVPDEIKIEYLLKMKNIDNTYRLKKNVFSLTLSIASELGDIEKYLKSELREDLNDIKSEEIYNSAFNAYLDKDFSKAERLFSSLLDINNLAIKEYSFNSLAFMVRRGEASKEKYSFIEYINGVSDEFIFKHMNMLLYYLQNDNADIEKCRLSYEMLQKASIEEIENLSQCWGDVDFVGEESVIGMIIIDSLTLNGQHKFEMITPSLINKFNLEVLKSLISC